MNLIPNIVLNERQIENLLKIGKISSGGEGIICKGDNPYTLYKIFVNNRKPIPMSENKKIKLLNYLTIIFTIVSYLLAH